MHSNAAERQGPSTRTGPRSISVGGVDHLVRVGDEAKGLKSGGPAARFMPPSKFAALIGADPHAGEHDLYAQIALGIREEAGEPAEWGRLLEPLVGQRWVERFDGGNFDRWRRGRAYTVGDWLKLYPDWEEDTRPLIERLGFEAPPGALLEAKTCSAYRVSDWEEGVPLYYQCQVQPYMEITGAGACHVALLVGGQQLRAYIVEHDPEFAGALLETAWLFWVNYVLPKRPPPIDGTRKARALLRQLYPRAAKTTRPALPHELDMINELRLARDNIAVLEERKALLENQLLESMGGDYALTSPWGKVAGVEVEAGETVSWKDVVTEMRATISVDQTLLTDLIAKYTKPREARRDLRCYFKGAKTAE